MISNIDAATVRALASREGIKPTRSSSTKTDAARYGRVDLLCIDEPGCVEATGTARNWSAPAARSGGGPADATSFLTHHHDPADRVSLSEPTDKRCHLK
ncbi:hypothetical protein SLNWT_2802 [Streptomyces albus]|uniref:Uncharacterized protein n=1 Tax=Streptomyces albus (strain ATCC 21838 / DSM 41398 / FERM P-419 / JCM 4703 / NBRC 107858) TaxID=1081613 RepID=A0A0B5ELA9_STRA4|nr:hypothetical protein SLNWT_2802 [Streptomyces albus]AOU77489.1 hypothetical protein SLNHY_2798 [Streptomyces albus]AYN33262.1 hypothetical protein DUI70_2761 [Streptomyces albus]